MGGSSAWKRFEMIRGGLPLAGAAYWGGGPRRIIMPELPGVLPPHRLRDIFIGPPTREGPPFASFLSLRVSQPARPVTIPGQMPCIGSSWHRGDSCPGWRGQKFRFEPLRPGVVPRTWPKFGACQPVDIGAWGWYGSSPRRLPVAFSREPAERFHIRLRFARPSGWPVMHPHVAPRIHW